MPEALAPWKGIPQGYGVEGHGLEGVRYEGYYLPPQFVASMLPWAGAELTRWMDDFDHLAQFGFMVRDESRGSVHRGPAGLPILRYRPSQRSLGRLKAGAALLAELLLAAGATEVATGVARAPIARTVAQARALKDLAITPFDLSLLGAHPLGTCRMGPDAARGVVDFDHRVFGTDNLYVVDGSVVPTSLGVNPQMTIMAFALRAADQLAALS
jgi:choline dehydrogenase-like flavoprotein